MIEDVTFAVVGGDLRQGCLANLLSDSGRSVYGLCIENCAGLRQEVICQKKLQEVLPNCDVIIFPLPLSSDGRTLNAPFSKSTVKVEECLQSICKDSIVLGGMVSKEIDEIAARHHLHIFDYYQREELIVRNCIPTAEGALAIAMQDTAKTIFGSRCLITGFGRVSRALAKLLTACGAKVTVAARKQEDLAWANIMGAEGVPMTALTQTASSMDIIFNTVPAKLFDTKILSGLSKDCLIIDLASKPGGGNEKISKFIHPLCRKNCLISSIYHDNIIWHQ